MSFGKILNVGRYASYNIGRSSVESRYSRKLTAPAKRGAAPASFPPSEPSAARFRFFLSFAAPLFLLTERFSMILQNAAFDGKGNEIMRRIT